MENNEKSTHETEANLHRSLAGMAVTEVGGIILQELLRQSPGNIDVRIIANTVARSVRTTSSIVLLCDNQDVQSAWVLHRTLAERLFHLAHLSRTRSYASFEEWSFFEQVRAQKKPFGDKMFRDRVTGKEYQLTAEQHSRFREMLKQPPSWRRPKAEEIAKSMQLKFIYDYAYDYASTLIHPMANDGEIDLIVYHQEVEYRQYQNLVIDNSLIILTLIFQEAMNSPPLNWCKAAYDMVDAVRAYIKDPTSEYQTPLHKSMALSAVNGLSGHSKN